MEPDGEFVTGGQVGQGLKTVAVVPDPGILMGGQVGQGLYSVTVATGPELVTGGQVGQGLVIVVKTLPDGAVGICTCVFTGEVWFLKGCGLNGRPVLR